MEAAALTPRCSTPCWCVSYYDYFDSLVNPNEDTTAEERQTTFSRHDESWKTWLVVTNDKILSMMNGSTISKIITTAGSALLSSSWKTYRISRVSLLQLMAERRELNIQPCRESKVENRVASDWFSAFLAWRSRRWAVGQLPLKRRNLKNEGYTQLLASR